MVRRRDVTRLEGFSDAVFGFVVTLLVVSLEVPESFEDLRRIIAGFPAFALTFTLICWVWYEHRLVFRRYDLDDGFTIVLNSVLLFIVVFYAYPLKFVVTRLVTGSLMGVGPAMGDGMTAESGRMLMLVYSGGFVALFLTFLLLHWNALRQRVRLGLGSLEVYDARANIQRHGISVAIGLMSMLLVVTLPPRWQRLAGLIFFLMGPAHGFFGYWNGRRRERLEAFFRDAGTEPVTNAG